MKRSYGFKFSRALFALVLLLGVLNLNGTKVAFAAPATASTFDSLSLAGAVKTAIYRTTSVISAVVSVESKVTFREDGKIVAGCKNKNTSAVSPFTATCSWKPAQWGAYAITATAVPVSSSYTASAATPLNVVVTRRSIPRFVFPVFSYNSVAFTSSTYLIMSPGITPGTSPFTIELWLKTGSTVKGGDIIGNGNSGTGLSFILDSAVKMHTDGYGVSATNFTLPFTLQPNTWYHFALVRDASNYETVWVNGARSTSGRQTDSRNYNGAATGINWAICTWCVAGSSKFNGERITNLRVLVGRALYDTSLATITVPSAPLSSIANTKLLLLANSSGTLAVDSSGTQTITNNGATFVTGN